MAWQSVLFNLLVAANGQVWKDVGEQVLGHFLDTEPGFPVVDFSEITKKTEIGGRVIDLVNGEHFDDVLRDTPDEMRPGGIVVFFGSSTCQKEYDDLQLGAKASTVLPHRSRLFIGRYDMDAAPKRAWYKFTPERDLAKRFGVTACPQLIYFPHTCDGNTEWCVKDEGSYGPGTRVLGCDNFKESCTGLKTWDGKGEYVDWVKQQVASEAEPRVNSLWKTYHFQDKFLESRDSMTSTTHFRNMFVAKAVPPFTPNGFKVVDIPEGLLKAITDFYYENLNERKIEEWDLTDTQNSFHDTIMHQINWDLNPRRDELAIQYIKPILEEWSGVEGLELTAFYGIREYGTDHFLRRHIDRTKTHVISATLTIAKLPHRDTNQTQKDLDLNAWPLDVIDFHGNAVQYDHPPGKMVLYESAKVPHGRSRKNPFKGGIHVGLFCHFAPPQKFMDWHAVQRFAEQYHQKHANMVTYRGSPVVEPTNPVFTERAYGAGAIDSSVGYEGQKAVNDERQVRFFNIDNVPRTLWWTNGDVTDEQCVGLQSEDFCYIGTYPGHMFFWTAVDSTVPLAGSHLTIGHSKRTYYFDPNFKKTPKPKSEL